MVESRGSAKVNDILHVGRESGADETRDTRLWPDLKTPSLVSRGLQPD